MNSIKEFVLETKGEQPRLAMFETVEELKAVPWVAAFRDKPGFKRFVVDRGRLMAECHGGRLWHIVGYLGNPLEGIAVAGR